MNIFVTDTDPKVAAQNLCDKHVVKMVLETAQLLCTAYENAPYKRTHYNHPCAKWARESIFNYIWLIKHGRAIAEEYSYRFGKTHKSAKVIDWCDGSRERFNIDWELDERTTFVICMPDQFKISSDPVECYREYYRKGKRHLHKWTNREVPKWITNPEQN